MLKVNPYLPLLRALLQVCYYQDLLQEFISCQITLHSFAEVVPPPLPVDDVLVYFAGRDVVVAVEGDVEESLVVTKVKVNFTPIVQHKDFTCSIYKYMYKRHVLLFLNSNSIYDFL